MKKSVLLAMIITLMGLEAFAEKNYTLMSNPNIFSQNRPIINSIRTNSPDTSSFSGAFSEAFQREILGNPENTFRTGFIGLDPYLIEINGTKYMLIKDNDDGIFNEKDILGIKDSTKNVFASLRPLDKNKDSKLTGDELTEAGVRLVRINSVGKLDYETTKHDFKNSDIEFIYLTELRKAYKNDGSTGQFGQYDVIIKNDKGEKSLVTGLVLFETEEEVQKYF